MNERHETTLQMLLDTLRGVLGRVARPDDVLRTVLQQAVTRTGAERGVFVEVDREGSMRFDVLHKFDAKELENGRGTFSRSIFKEVLVSGHGVLIEDAMNDQRFMSASSVQSLRLVSVLCLPVRIGGRIAALVHLESNRPTHFTAEHRELVRSLIDLATPVLETLREGRKLIAERDSLETTAERYRSELGESRKVLSEDWSFGRFLGRSAPVRELDAAVRRACATDFPVLIMGETGTGKSLLARIIHASSARSDQSLVTVFCPSLEGGMVETELFGHKRGAFTGADNDREGKVQAADKGTLFLDEIGELPSSIQPKLLRLLHEKAYERVGDATEHRADVRVIAATNRDLRAAIADGRFREDLYQRLNFLPIRVPPLRERREDIPLLLRHTLDQSEAGRWVTIDADAESFLETADHAWSGNVREVEQLAARLAVRDGREPVGREELAALLAVEPARPAAASENASLEDGLPAAIAAVERRLIEEAVRTHPGATRAELATKLKISERALYNKLRTYGITG